MYPPPDHALRLGSVDSSSASFEVMACSTPRTSGSTGRPPVATRMVRAVWRLPATSTV